VPPGEQCFPLAGLHGGAKGGVAFPHGPYFRKVLPEANGETRKIGSAPAGTQTSPTALRYYVVRPGDFYARISADPRVYNDGSLWRRLYEANREKMPDPDNPHLIFPGMTIEIPSLNGEPREGTY
jgi:nucleoid-associated protein YgaU